VTLEMAAHHHFADESLVAEGAAIGHRVPALAKLQGGFRATVAAFVVHQVFEIPEPLTHSWLAPAESALTHLATFPRLNGLSAQPLASTHR
jgi:hypothetical protein